MTELKPCPFCGGKAEVREYIAITDYVYVICRNCGVCAGPYGTEEKAAKNWNRRVNKVQPVKHGWGIVSSAKECLDSLVTKIGEIVSGDWSWNEIPLEHLWIRW